MQMETNRQVKYKRKKTKKRRVLIGLIMSFFIFCGVAAGAVLWKLDNTLDSFVDEQDPVTTIEDQAMYNQEPISILIIGTDERADLGLANTDVIIVAALNPETKHVTMMPIPRDTGVEIPGYKGYYKINSVYTRGEIERRDAERNNKPVTVTGTTLLKQTVEEALGIPINHYVMTDFVGFERVIDELGGLHVHVDKSMRYDDPTDGTHIDLVAGEQLLGGKEALDFVRHRKDNRGSQHFSTDFDRGIRQQLVVKNVVDKMKTFSGLSSFFNVMNIAGDHIRTDLSKEQIKGLVLDFKSIGSENIAGLETGGYWDIASSHTIIPQENLEEIQFAFQQEMGVERHTFRSSIRVEGPGQQRQQPQKSPVIPKTSTQKAAKSNKQRTASESSTPAEKKGSSNNKKSVTPDSQTNDVIKKPKKDAGKELNSDDREKSEDQEVKQDGDLLEPPVNTEQVEPPSTSSGDMLSVQG